MEQRYIQPADLDGVFSIESRAYADPWSRDLLEQSLTAPLTHSMAFFEEGVCRAYAIYQVIFTEAHLLNIAVDPSFQAKGLGKKLLEQVMQDSHRRGAESMYLEVRPSNETARKLYEKKAFRLLLVREKYYSNGEAALVMVADLAD